MMPKYGSNQFTMLIQHFCKSTSLIKLFAIESTEKYRLIGEIGDDDEVAVPCNNFPYNPNKQKCHANTRYKVWRMSRNVIKQIWALPLPSLPPQSLISARSAKKKLGFEPGDLFRGFRVTRRCRAARAGLIRGRLRLPWSWIYSTPGNPEKKKMALYTPGQSHSGHSHL